MTARILDVSSLTKFIRNSKNFDRVFEKVKILAVGNGRCSAELKVDESHTNVIGGLSGGFSASLVDCISNYALLNQTESPSISLDLHISYLKRAAIGDDILIDANMVRQGKTAFLEVEIKNKTNGEVLVKGSHTKYII